MSGFENSPITICTKCGETSRLCLSLDLKCKYCGGEMINTGKDHSYWVQIYYDAHPGSDGWNTTGVMVDNYMRELILGDTYDQQLHEAVETHIHEKLYGGPKCPKCGSNSIRQDKQGFSIGRAAITTAVTGFIDVGAVAGTVGSNKMVNVCNRCGNKWK